MGLARSHPEKTNIQHYTLGPDVESRGERKQRRPRNAWRRGLEADNKQTNDTWKGEPRTYRKTRERSCGCPEV